VTTRRPTLPAFADGCIDDINALPSVELRRVAVKILQEVEAGTLHGRPLDSRPSTGDLTDCFKIYFDDQAETKPRFRIVYRMNPDGRVTAARVQAIAVGQRSALAAYYDAARRLGRLPNVAPER
jgi:hypothetical protein